MSGITTPLHTAVQEGNLEAVKMLLDAGHDPNAEDAAEMTPLHLAAQFGHTEIAAVLAEKIKTKSGTDATATNTISTATAITISVVAATCLIALFITLFLSPYGNKIYAMLGKYAFVAIVPLLLLSWVMTGCLWDAVKPLRDKIKSVFPKIGNIISFACFFLFTWIIVVVLLFISFFISSFIFDSPGDSHGDSLAFTIMIAFILTLWMCAPIIRNPND